MKNNKGFTLMELMISISLVSVVMIFTLNLLNDIRAEEALGTNKTADLTNRTIITRIVQDDFYEKGIRQVGYNVSVGNAKYCPIAAGVFQDEYDFYIMKCVVIYYNDNTCGLLAVGGEDATAPANMFMYAKKDGTTCNDSSGYIPEIWDLSSATYSVETDSSVERIPELIRSTNTIENVEENVLAGNQGNFFFLIKFPAIIPEAYSNTSMNFDLEFSYYTTNTNGFTHASGEDYYLNYTNLSSSTMSP